MMTWSILGPPNLWGTPSTSQTRLSLATASPVHSCFVGYVQGKGGKGN